MKIELTCYSCNKVFLWEVLRKGKLKCPDCRMKALEEKNRRHHLKNN